MYNNYEKYDIINSSMISICKKLDVNLLKDKNNDVFVITFSCNNINIPFKNLISFSIYKLIGEINSDLLEKIEFINIIKEDEEANILLLFKDFCKDLGIGKKYMYINVKREIIDNNYVFISTDLEYEHKNKLEKNGYSKIKNEISNMTISILNNNKFNVFYSFKFDINEPLPLYMKNIPGILMKKIFINLKNVIENNYEDFTSN
jgi:hypothetical protein